MLSKEFCELEALKYIAFRYDTTPEQLRVHLSRTMRDKSIQRPS